MGKITAGKRFCMKRSLIYLPRADFYLPWHSPSLMILKSAEEPILKLLSLQSKIVNKGLNRGNYKKMFAKPNKNIFTWVLIARNISRCLLAAVPKGEPNKES